MMVEVDAIGSIITELLKSYGVTGLAFGGLLYLLWKNKKDADVRITELEKQADTQQVQMLTNYKEMIGEYIEIVKNNGEMVGKLTVCVDAMHQALNRFFTKEDPKP